MLSSPTALAAWHASADWRCWPEAAWGRAPLRSAVQLGDVSGVVRRWGYADTVGGGVRGGGRWRSSSIRPECNWRGTVMNREDRELLY